MYRLPISVLAVVAVVALAGCGGGTSAPKASGSTSTSTTVAGGRFQNAAFTSCLKEHGVTLPAGGFGGFGGRRGGASGASGASGRGGFTRPSGASGASGRRPTISIPGVSATKVQSALAACRSKLPNGGRFGGGAGGANAGASRAYLSCLSDHGVTIPTTTTGTGTATSGPSGNGGGFGGLNGVRNQPKFAAANKVCRALLPTGG